MRRFFLLTIFLLHYGPVYAGWLAGRSPATLKPGTGSLLKNALSTTRSGKQLAGSPNRPTRPLAAPFSPRRLLDVVVEEELVRMRSQPHRIDLLAPLVADPSLDQVLGKHLSLEQKLMILF